MFNFIAVRSTTRNERKRSKIIEFTRALYIFFNCWRTNVSSSIESFFRDGSMRSTDHRGLQDTYISRIYLRPLSTSSHTFQRECTCALPSPSRAKISPVAGVEAAECRTFQNCYGYPMDTTCVLHMSHHRLLLWAWTWSSSRHHLLDDIYRFVARKH